MPQAQDGRLADYITPKKEAIPFHREKTVERKTQLFCLFCSPASPPFHHHITNTYTNMASKEPSNPRRGSTANSYLSAPNVETPKNASGKKVGKEDVSVVNPDLKLLPLIWRRTCTGIYISYVIIYSYRYSTQNASYAKRYYSTFL